jgi:hypothetical protein
MLATSDEIATASEPWLLLPLIYTLKPDGIKAEYGHNLSVRAIRDFYEQFPNGRQDYLEEMRKFTLNLYSKNYRPGVVYFIDKTPRYHLVINEIIEIFPEGKFIFLWRNPLAVVSSIINSWCNGKWKPRAWNLDLYAGTKNIITAYNDIVNNNNTRVHSLQYETLVRDSSTEMMKICEYLSIDYTDKMIYSFQNVNLNGGLGDKSGVKNYKSVSNSSIDKWKTTFNNPFRRHWAKKYLNWLGEDNLRTMGYDYDDLIESISRNKHDNYKYILPDMARSVFDLCRIAD